MFGCPTLRETVPDGGETDASTQMPEPDAGSDGGITVLPMPRLRDCELERAWNVRNSQAWFNSRTLTRAAGGNLFAIADARRATFYRARDGALAGWQSPGNAPGVLKRDGRLSSSWTFTARVGADAQVVVEENLTGNQQVIAWPVPAPNEARLEREAVVDETYGVVVALDCFYDTQIGLSDHAILRWKHLHDSGGGFVDLGYTCNSSASARARLTPSRNGQWAVVTGLYENSIVTVDLLAATKSSATGWMQGAPLVVSTVVSKEHALAAAAGEANVVVAGADGKLYFFEAATMMLMPAPLDIGTPLTNSGSFEPGIESPVVFSTDGKTMAYVTPGGATALLDLETQQVFKELTSNNPDDAPAGLLVEEATVTISYSRGLERWQCKGLAPTIPRTLLVTIEGPAMRPTTSTAADVFQVKGEGHAPFALRALLFNGDFIGQAGFRPSLDYLQTGQPPGSYSLTGVIDDGVAFGGASMMLQIVP
jgi:hypothetical protein